MKETWKILNNLIGKKKKDYFPDHFVIDNQRVTNSTEIATSFNTFFTGIGKTLNESLGKPSKSFHNHMKGHYPNNFYLKPISPAELIDISRKIRSKTSKGHDGISSKLMKETIHEIAIPLTHIMNLSFSNGIVPDDMKIAKIIPIFKSGNHSSFNNYRPISLLPAFSKIMEKIVYIQLWSFLKKFNVIYEHQYGFRSKHSTIHPILQLVKFISERNDTPSKEITAAIFIDLSKAFDTIDHSILLSKLNHYGIRGIPNHWFRSYLSNRKQFTNYKDANSLFLDILCGVPQGSILGPLLFLIYINDLSNATSLNLLSFADDTTVYLSGSDMKIMSDIANDELAKLSDYFCANKLCFNVDKTQLSIFGPNQNMVRFQNFKVKLNNKEISMVVNPVKFLGIFIDQHLNWKYHIAKVSSKISRATYCINRLKHLIPKASLVSLYYSLIHCHLTYGIHLWGNSTHVNKLYKSQKKIIRIISNKKYTAHSQPLLRECNILNLTDLYQFHSNLLVHDWFHDQLPISFRSYFIHSPRMTDSHKYILFRKRPRTKFTECQSVHQLPRIWNDIPVEMKSINSKRLFKTKIKSRMLELYVLPDECTNPNCPDHANM